MVSEEQFEAQRMRDIERFDEMRHDFDKCVGQEKCNDCPRYMDDCDGREDMIEDEPD